MLVNQVLHKTIQDIRHITGLECSVWDLTGGCLVMTNEKQLLLEKQVLSFFKQEEVTEQIVAGCGMFPVYDDEELVYVLVLQGNGTDLSLSGRMGASQIENLAAACKERMDKNRFIQNLILDNLLLVDVYNQAKKMKVPVEQRRAVFLIEPKHESDNLVLETLKGLYATGSRDFVTAVDEGHIILVKALEPTQDYEALNQTARIVADTLNMEAMVSVRVAFGTIVNELKDVSKSYKEAGMALEVGRVFYVERNILAYNELGIGRLIHQLPVSLCEMFLKEVFTGGVFNQFDEEELATVYTFFENNLNISETARKLFVHRNTLVYRLEKIQKKTGLDVRVFEDALTFKIAMMVAEHMKHMNK